MTRPVSFSPTPGKGGRRAGWLLIPALVPAALLIWWPLWFMLTGAAMPQDELLATVGPALGAGGAPYASWHLLPSWPTLQPLAELLLDTPQFFIMFWNTVRQVFPQVLGQLAVGAPAAWALSRLRFRGRGAVRALYIVLMLMPFQVTMVPNYLVLGRLSLLDTVWSVILPGIFSTFPVFIMERGFDAVPRALLEAAAIDGANQRQVFCRIGLPVGLPGVLGALTLSFLEAWNAIEQPMTFLKERRLWPLSLYLPEITADKAAVAWAASAVAMILPVSLFLMGQGALEQGIAAAGIKE